MPFHAPWVKFEHTVGVDSFHRLTVGKPCHLKGKTCRKLQMDRILIILKYDPGASSVLALGYIAYSCTPDRNCHTFCLGDKIASHPGVLTQAKCAKNITQNLEINQIWRVVVQEKESNMVFFSRWKFPNPRDDRAEWNRGGASVPLSTVIPWVGIFHLEQNPI